MPTVADIVNQARVKYPDMDATGLGVDLFNTVHNRILTQAQVQTDVETFSSLVSGTKVYDVQTTARKVWSALYYRSSTAGDLYKLKARSVEEFEAYLPTYAGDASGTPQFYYVRFKNDGQLDLGLHPTPDTSTSGGYPKVVLRVSRGAVLTSTGNLPLGVADYSAWVSGLMAEYARLKRGPDEAGQMLALAEHDLGNLQRFSHGLLEESPSSAVPRYSWRRRTRV